LAEDSSFGAVKNCLSVLAGIIRPQSPEKRSS
jgi:hypothetical protein